MADSISIKDRKFQKRQNKLKGKEVNPERQEKNTEEIKDMANEVNSGSRSSKIKSLSEAKKKEMLEEYEKVIKKLKELELRNKKKQDFKYNFKGLKYFTTLNGHSVYSESMQSQAKADKDSISAMMAYGQLGAGFEITFEQFMVNVRPERRQEFLSLCKNNSTLSHNLMGMGKVLQFYNQKDFTRAYAAMVFFGLENHMDLMETFLKVKFNADFKTQVDTFKAQIANASVFEEKAIREEAGTNVFSQHDSQMTSMQSSYYGKDVVDIVHDVIDRKLQYKQNQTIDEEIKTKAETYRFLMDKHNGNQMGVAVEVCLERREKKEEEKKKSTKKIESETTLSANTALRGKVNEADLTRVSENLSTLKAERAASHIESSYIYAEQNTITALSEKYANLVELERVVKDPAQVEGYKKAREEVRDAITLERFVSILDGRLVAAETKKDKLLSERATIERDLKTPMLSPEERKKKNDRINEINKELASMQTPESIISETIAASGRTPQLSESEFLRKYKQTKSKAKVDFSKPIEERNGFEAAFNENRFNKSGLQRLLYAKRTELDKATKTPGKEDTVARLLSEISRIENQLKEIEKDNKLNALVQNTTDKRQILELLSGEQEVSLESFKLILNLADKSQLEKILGRELTKNEFIQIRQFGFHDNHFKINNEEAFISLLTRKLEYAYVAMVENNLSPDVSILEETLADIDKKITLLDSQISQLKAEQESTEDAEKKKANGIKISGIRSRISLLQETKKKIIKKQKEIEIEKEEQAKEKLKSPEEILENQLEHVIKRKLTTNMGTKAEPDIRFIDELTDEQLEEKGITTNSILNSVNMVFDGLEKIVSLELDSITQGNMNRAEDGMRRGLVLLEKLKDKIPEKDYEVLKAKSEWLAERVKSLSSLVVKENSEKENESSRPNEIKTTTEGKTGSDELFAEAQTETVDNVAGRTGLMSGREVSADEQEIEIAILSKQDK